MRSTTSSQELQTAQKCDAGNVLKTQSSEVYAIGATASATNLRAANFEAPERAARRAMSKVWFADLMPRAHFEATSANAADITMSVMKQSQSASGHDHSVPVANNMGTHTKMTQMIGKNTNEGESHASAAAVTAASPIDPPG
jgi:hypothetical protein